LTRRRSPESSFVAHDLARFVCSAPRVVTHIPLGEWRGFGAARDTINLPSPLPPVMVFSGVSKK
jgi:hypothetical protein